MNTYKHKNKPDICNVVCVVDPTAFNLAFNLRGLEGVILLYRYFTCCQDHADNQSSLPERILRLHLPLPHCLVKLPHQHFISYIIDHNFLSL